MKILYLTLNKEWFDMILSGMKTDEYRCIKQYFISRFVNKEYIRKCHDGNHIKFHSDNHEDFWKEYDFIEFSNGYSSKSRKMVVKFKGFEIGFGKELFGAVPGTEYFILKLGKITDTKNCFKPANYGQNNDRSTQEHRGWKPK